MRGNPWVVGRALERQVEGEHNDVSWPPPLGHELTAAEWHDSGARALGVLTGQAFRDPYGTPNGHLLFLCNASDQPIDFCLPAPKTNLVWQIVFDTARWRANDLGTRIAAGANSYRRPLAPSQTDELGTHVPNLIEAMFTNFPGENGKTVKITVPGRKRG